MYVKECIRDIERIGGRQGRQGFLRLDMNENPESLPAELVERIKRELTPEFFAVYPEPERFLLVLSDYLGVGVENLCVTNGSDMALRYLFEIFGRPGSAAVTVSPTFEMYRINCLIFGLRHKPVSYNPDFSLDLDRVLDAITDEVSIVSVLNPNNPIGTVYTEEEFDRIVKKAAAVGALVIVDEAYHYFYEKTFLKKIFLYDNVVLVRTFSKLFSSAAVRLGFLVGNKRLIHYVWNVRPTFDTNAVALKFGERLLQEPGLIGQLTAIEREGREYLKKSLAEHGYVFYAEHGNYAFIRTKHPPAWVRERLEEKKILIKTYCQELLKDYIRISTGSVRVMERFAKAFYEVDR
ncbi:MAG: aminotransferase class I/II-fold pyridoxal phosphate-dependent enzyme [Lachnospiraceae bacterium]|nr:aminotransferase class I/II-fold pyridoxal phosphate-dependent enzyme [Lachnospiraceae bacterium]